MQQFRKKNNLGILGLPTPLTIKPLIYDD